jgi:hypothetical protein
MSTHVLEEEIDLRRPARHGVRSITNLLQFIDPLENGGGELGGEMINGTPWVKHRLEGASGSAQRE